MNESSESARRRLHEAGHAKDTAKRFAWGFLISATVLEVLLGVALIDYWLVLPSQLRLGGFGLLLVLLAAGAAGWLKLRRRPTSMKEAALDTEAQRPGIGCVVSTAAEYMTGERKITHEYEPELVAALEEQAGRNLEKAHVSYANRMLGPAGFLAFALLTLLIFAAVAPVAFTALKRTVVPWSKETYTKVEVRPGSVEIPVGQDLDITNVFSGRSPKAPALRWQEADKPAWQSVALKKSDDGFYIHPFRKLQNSVKYQVTGDDAASEIYDITTYVPPEVQALRVDVAYPPYTRVKPFFQQTPELTVLRASDLTFRITASTALAKARLRFSTLLPVDLTPGGQSNEWTGTFKAAKDVDYWIELADAKGHKGGNEKPYHLTVLPDHPPKVEIIDPAQDIRAEATNTIPLRVAAMDDFGVAEINIVYHRLGAPDQSLACKFTNTVRGEVLGGADLALAGLGLKEYDVVAYHAEAKDNNTLDGPGKGSSPVYFIEITNEEGAKKPKPKKPQEEGQKMNLLAIQKQIIADTTVLAAKAAADKFDELAAREKEATEYAGIYRDSMAQLKAPEEATKLMEDALTRMKTASGALGEKNRDTALPPEEQALADLYQILKLMPKLGEMPTEPPPEEEQMKQDPALNVVLDAIKKQKKEPPTNQELAEALTAAKQISRAQADLLPALERPGQQDEQGDQQSQTAPPSDQAGTQAGNQAAKAGGKTGEPKDNPDAQAQAKAGQPKDGDPAKAGDKSDEEKKADQAKVGEGKQEPDAKTGEGKNGENAKTGEGKKGQEAKAGEKAGEGKSDQEAKAGEQPGQGKGKEGQQAKAGGKPGQGKKGQQGKNPGEPGEGKEPQEAQADQKPPDEKQAQDLEKVAELENELSKEAAALADKLQKLARMDNRLPHNAAEKASQAAGQMGAASKALRQGNVGAAGTEGGQSLLTLDKVIAALERLVKDQPNLTDVATEDYPKEYEGLIADYLRKLSHEQ